MKMRSTGLGKKELIGDVTGIEARNDHLILHLNTTSPVHWHIRIALSRRDIFSVLKVASLGILKRPTIRVLLGRTKGLPPLEPY